MTETGDPLADFIVAAAVPRDASHASGSLERAEAIRAAHPELERASLYAAALLGEDAAVRRFLSLDPASATEPGGPYGWDPLTHLCFSRYLRLDPARSPGFLRAASALLDAGASANSGWWERGHHPGPVWESVLYGAAGVAHHAELTRLLLARGGDPNDGETPYHAPEGYENAALRVLVESDTLTADSLTTILLRKHDWHDTDAVRWLLERGVDPNRRGRWGRMAAIHFAVTRDNATACVELLLDHGADPLLPSDGGTAVTLAARRGRGDLLELFARRGVPLALAGADALLAAIARNDAAEAGALLAHAPGLMAELLARGGELLARFAGNGNTEGVRLLLDLGVPVTARFEAGDGYFGVARNSMALHVAAWRARHRTVRLLLERGAPVEATDGEGRTPLALAIRACVDSFWMDRRSPESVEALLEAGASAHGVAGPTGYEAVDEALRMHGGLP